MPIFLFIALCLNCIALANDYDEPMKFEAVYSGGNFPNTRVIYAVGVIQKDSPQKFKKIANENPYYSYVEFDSPGGDLLAGLELGYMIEN